MIQHWIGHKPKNWSPPWFKCFLMSNFDVVSKSWQAGVLTVAVCVLEKYCINKSHEHGIELMWSFNCRSWLYGTVTKLLSLRQTSCLPHPSPSSPNLDFPCCPLLPSSLHTNNLQLLNTCPLKPHWPLPRALLTKVPAAMLSVSGPCSNPSLLLRVLHTFSLQASVVRLWSRTLGCWCAAIGYINISVLVSYKCFENCCCRLSPKYSFWITEISCL